VQKHFSRRRSSGRREFALYRVLVLYFKLMFSGGGSKRPKSFLILNGSMRNSTSKYDPALKRLLFKQQAYSLLALTLS